MTSIHSPDHTHARHNEVSSVDGRTPYCCVAQTRSCLRTKTPAQVTVVVTLSKPISHALQEVGGSYHTHLPKWLPLILGPNPLPFPHNSRKRGAFISSIIRADGRPGRAELNPARRLRGGSRTEVNRCIRINRYLQIFLRIVLTSTVRNALASLLCGYCTGGASVSAGLFTPWKATFSPCSVCSNQ